MLALLGGVRPVLDAQRLPRHGDAATGQDRRPPRRPGAAVSDASQLSPRGPTLEPGSLEPRGRRETPDGHQQRVRLDARPVAEPASQAGSLAGAGVHAFERGAEPQVDALVAMHRCADAADERPDGSLERDGERSTTVTSAPSPRAVAATSRPMKPAPAMTSRAPGREMTARKADRVLEGPQASARRGRPVIPGSGRGIAPVAITSPSN